MADELDLALMKLLSSKHFPLRQPRAKIKLEKLVMALGRMGTETSVDSLFELMNTLKGRGICNTEPKIILKDEVDTATFEIWLTPLGRTELTKRVSS